MLPSRAGVGAPAAGAGADVGLGENGGWQHGAARNVREPALLLLLCAAEPDQLGRDLGACAERADADIAARQLLRDHAHGHLAHAEPAPFFRHGEAEHAHIRHVPDNGHGNEFVAAVPSVGRPDDAVVRESAELVPHQGQRLVLQSVGRPLALGKQGGNFHARGVRIALCCDAPDGRNAQCRAVEAEVRRPHDLPLRDRDAAGKLRQILPEGRLQDEPVQLREGVGGFESPRPAEHFAQARDISCDPGKTVGGELVAFQCGGIGPTAGLHTRRNAAARVIEIGLGCGERLFEEGDREGHGVGRTPFSSGAL